MMNRIIIGSLIAGAVALAAVFLPRQLSPPTSPQTSDQRSAEQDTAAEEVTALSNEIAVLRQQTEREREADQNTIRNLQQLIERLEQQLAELSPEDVSSEITDAFEGMSERIAALENRPPPQPSSPTETTAQYEVQSSPGADIIWIEPLVVAAPPRVADTVPASEPLASSPRLTIPPSSVVFARSLTALVGRIPVHGRIENPWRFKLIATPKNFTSKNYFVPDLEGVIWTGVAHGDYTLSCVSGTIDTISYVFRDGTVHTQRSAANPDDITQGLGWISDEYGNPCIPGSLKTNAAQFLRRSILASSAAGLARGYADAQTTRTSDQFSGRSTTTVTGDATNFALATAAADAVSATERWQARRLDQSFDAIYVAAGKSVVIHIEQQIELDYEALGRQLDHSVARLEQPVYQDDSIGGLD